MVRLELLVSRLESRSGANLECLPDGQEFALLNNEASFSVHDRRGSYLAFAGFVLGVMAVRFGLLC